MLCFILKNSRGKFFKKPLDRVSYGGNVHWKFPPIFLIYGRQKGFAFCGKRPKALPLETTTFEKVDETLFVASLWFTEDQFPVMALSAAETTSPAV